MRMEPAIGIDLGTTHCCVAVYQNGVAEVILNDQGNKTTPSMVAFTDTEILLGEAAKHQVATNPANTVFDIKRLIGRRFADPAVQADIRHWPFAVVPDAAGADPLVEVEYQGRRQRYTPQQISSMVLAKMKSIAEAYVGSTLRHAVVTVPAYFTDSQRECTKAAAALAGLHVLRIINEPSAAAIAYGFRPEVLSGADGARTVLVFDLGGGTFDVSVVNVHGGGRFDVVATAGDMRLGGEDFDSNLVDHCVAQFYRRNPSAQSDIRRHPRALRRLGAECERAKRNLSAAHDTHIHIDGLLDGCDLALKISRARFQELNEALFRRCIDVVHSCLADAGIAADAVDHVVLVGGSTRIPRVQELIREFFGGRNVLCRNVNPDEAVAVGAAIQAASLHSEATEVTVQLQDVLPVSLGVSIDGGQMNVVLPKNTPIPAKRERVYTTRLDNQSEVSFPVYEGDNARVKDNYLVGEFKLTGIPPAPAGQPDIKVLFFVDENGILTISATDTNRAQSTIVITKVRQLQDSGSDNGKRPVIPASPNPRSRAVEESSSVKNSRRWWHIFICS